MTSDCRSGTKEGSDKEEEMRGPCTITAGVKIEKFVVSKIGAILALYYTT